MASLMENKVLLVIGTEFTKSILTGNQESIDCLSEIITARKNGNILVYVSTANAQKISDCMPDIKLDRQQRIFDSISRNSRQKRALLKDLEVYLLVHPKRNKKPIKKNRAIVISPDFITSKNLLQPPVFLAENLTDCDFYADGIASNFRAGLPPSLRDLKTSDRFEGGGGNSTYKPYGRYKKSQSAFCLCIVDSDRSHPNAAQGETAKSVVKTNSKNPSPLCDLRVIDAYSAENLLPVEEIFRQFAIGKNQADIQKFDLIRSIMTANSWKFLPLKKGLRGKDLKKGDGYANYWSEILRAHGKALPCCAVDDCNCSIVPTISDKTLSAAVKTVSNHWQHLLDGERQEELRREYATISIAIKSWLCAGHPIRL